MMKQDSIPTASLKRKLFLIGAILLYSVMVFLAIHLDHFYLRIAVVGIPVLIVTVYFALFHPKFYGYLLAVALPFSVNLEDIGMGVGVSLPGEVLAAVMAIVVLINLFTGRYISKKVLKHPVTIALLINLGWMTISALLSTMPVVSAKYMLIRILFILVFYFFLLQFMGNTKDIQRFLWLFGLSMTFVIIYALLRHQQFQFIQQVNAYVVKPFFKDHTIYGATIAMLFPFFAGFLLIPGKKRVLSTWWSLLIIPFLIAGMIFSYSRAVWLSVAVAVIATLFLLFRIRFMHIVFLLAIVVGIGLYHRDAIEFRIKNVESQRGSDIKEHATSIANLNTSASNLERINRWEAGLDMFKKKPIVGYGPGTYPFQYAPFQNEELMTRISTYAGDKGGVHSEYLKPLSESGLPGFLSFLAVIIFTVTRGMSLAYHADKRRVRMLAALLLLGLTTYYVHGFFNFFLHTDKVAALFWGMTAFIVALDMKYKRQSNKT